MKRLLSTLCVGFFLLTLSSTASATPQWMLYSNAKTSAACLALKGKGGITNALWTSGRCLITKKTTKRPRIIKRFRRGFTVQKMYHLKRPLNHIRMLNVPGMFKKAKRLRAQAAKEQQKASDLRNQTQQLQSTIQLYEKELLRLKSMYAKKTKQLKTLQKSIRVKQTEASRLTRKGQALWRTGRTSKKQSH